MSINYNELDASEWIDFKTEAEMYNYTPQRGLCPAKLIECIDKNDPPCERGCTHFYRCYIE